MLIILFLISFKLMFTRIIGRYFTQSHKHLNAAEMIAKMKDLRTHIKEHQDQLVVLQKQVKDKETQTSQKNKAIHQKRIKLTEDFKKAEQLWVDAKKKSEANKSAAIQEFASSLIRLGNHFNHTKSFQSDKHSTDLREGFDNTVRLFFSTLQKFKVKQTELKQGSTFKKDEVEIVGHQKSQKEEQKSTIAKIVSQGWQLQGKTIVKPKVIVYN